MDRLREISPEVDTSFGTIARSIIEAYAREGADFQGRLAARMGTPLFRRLSASSIAQQMVAVEPLPLPAGVTPFLRPGEVYAASEPEFVGRMPVRADLPLLPLPEPQLPSYASEDAAMSMALAMVATNKAVAEPPLPDWCREGQLVRRREDGDTFRILDVGTTMRLTVRLADSIGTSVVFLFVGVPFESVYEPIEAKTRWELLMEEDELVGVG